MRCDNIMCEREREGEACWVFHLLSLHFFIHAHAFRGSHGRTDRQAAVVDPGEGGEAINMNYKPLLSTAIFLITISYRPSGNTHPSPPPLDPLLNRQTLCAAPDWSRQLFTVRQIWTETKFILTIQCPRSGCPTSRPIIQIQQRQ